MRFIVLILAVMIATSCIVYGQEAQPTPPQSDQNVGSTKTPRINKRQRNQQRRISQGINSGQLTAGEAARLEKREAKIQHDKQAAKADGKVTTAERRKLNREENQASRKIYKLKHNQKTQKP
jgi:hypothetical protein